MAETRDLPAYSGPSASCPKCGTSHAGTIWHPGPKVGREEKTERGVYWGCVLVPGIRGHLCRECQVCGFSWAEACADAPRGKPA